MIKRIVLFSDTHGLHGQVNMPNDVDMAIFAGDAGTYKNPYTNKQSVLDFIEWYASVPIPIKIWVAGNHCTSIEAGLVDANQLSQEKGLIYLQHESITIEGLEIFGSPYTPYFWNWAYNVNRGDLHNYWEDIPPTTDILVIHGGPSNAGKLNVTLEGDEVGCTELETFLKGPLKDVKVFCQGHIHEGYGTHYFGDMLLVNASVLNRDYKLVNKPFILTFDVENKKVIKIEQYEN